MGAGTRPSQDSDSPVGNGHAISILAACEGAVVACLDMDEAAARTTVAMVEAEGGHASVLVGDVCDPRTASSCVAEASEVLGGLDGLVLNVGIGRGFRLSGTTPDDWDAAFAVNVRAHFLAVQAAVDCFESGSSIVFVSSVAGLRPGSGIPSYDSSKAASTGLCRHVALESGRRGIRANIVAPGLIDTPLGDSPLPVTRTRTNAGATRATRHRGRSRQRRCFMSNRASYITGQILAVDGGLTLV